jgi:hypothetical protein
VFFAFVTGLDVHLLIIIIINTEKADHCLVPTQKEYFHLLLGRSSDRWVSVQKFSGLSYFAPIVAHARDIYSCSL